jgi:hypothetical protein
MRCQKQWSQSRRLQYTTRSREGKMEIWAKDGGIEMNHNFGKLVGAALIGGLGVWTMAMPAHAAPLNLEFRRVHLDQSQWTWCDRHGERQIHKLEQQRCRLSGVADPRDNLNPHVSGVKPNLFAQPRAGRAQFRGAQPF